MALAKIAISFGDIFSPGAFVIKVREPRTGIYRVEAIDVIDSRTYAITLMDNTGSRSMEIVMWPSKSWEKADKDNVLRYINALRTQIMEDHQRALSALNAEYDKRYAEVHQLWRGYLASQPAETTGLAKEQKPNGYSTRI